LGGCIGIRLQVSQGHHHGKRGQTATMGGNLGDVLRGGKDKGVRPQHSTGKEKEGKRDVVD